MRAGLVGTFAAGCAAILLALSSARAAEPSDAEVSARLAYLERVIERDQRWRRWWHDGWLGVFGAATLVQGGLAIGVRSEEVRVPSIVGAVKAAIAFTALLASPATGRTAATTLSRIDATTPAER